MCLGVPGRVVAVSDDGETATLDLAGGARQVSLALLSDDPPAIGDWVTVHTGFAMSRLTEEDAREALDAIDLLGPDTDDVEGGDLRAAEAAGAA
jgi:hydrogenase expression/formation protein HypC